MEQLNEFTLRASVCISSIKSILINTFFVYFLKICFPASNENGFQQSNYNENDITTSIEKVPLSVTAQVTNITQGTSDITASSTIVINASRVEPIIDNTVHQNIEITTNNIETSGQNVSVEENFNQTPSNSSNPTIAGHVNLSVEVYRNYAKSRLLPSRMFCGVQQTNDRNTALHEFPWIAHIIFKFLADELDDIYQYSDRCNGVLISNRYVLTSEYCAAEAPSVKLGYHNCTDYTGISDCTKPRIEINVVEEIHRENVSNAWHNLALLRLAEEVIFTDFVRPICLNLDYDDIPRKHDSLIFSGWELTGEENVILKRFTYNVTQNIDQCLRWDEKDLKNAGARGEAVCLIPQKSDGELACTGDEGGPLMYTDHKQWFAEGLITQVYDKIPDEKCSNELPISGIKITKDVLNWILDNMRD